MRLIACADCLSTEVIPDFTGRPDEEERDPLLLRIMSAHYGPPNREQLARRPKGAGRLRSIRPPGERSDEPMGEPHNIKGVYVVSNAQWNHPMHKDSIRRQVMAQIWGDHTGYDPEFYAHRETFREDAGVCYNLHGRPGSEHGNYACIDFEDESKRLTDNGWIERGERMIGPDGSPAPEHRDHVYLCAFCLTGDTEVVTRDGISPIRDLAGQSPDLLVPRRDAHGGLRSSTGRFQTAPVRSFGVQDVLAVTLTRGTSRQVVRATGDHRWAVGKDLVPTKDLVPGTRLRSLFTPPMPEDTEVPFAVAQGFVYGDGSVGSGDERPASLTIYADAPKDKALLPYFSVCEPRQNPRTGDWVIYGLPRTWKKAPDIRESRSFLVSWLAGYFAADGSVSENSQAVLCSADRKSIEFARSVAAICGIRTTPIRSKMRVGFPQQEPTALYSIGINPGTCPPWFFKIEEHRRRVEAHAERRAVLKRRVNYDWSVVSVEPAGSEEVFCATVEGPEAFGLAHELMTGNCPFSSVVMVRRRALRGDYDA